MCIVYAYIVGVYTNTYKYERTNEPFYMFVDLYRSCIYIAIDINIQYVNMNTDVN